MKTYVVIEDDNGGKVELTMEQARGLFATPAPCVGQWLDTRPLDKGIDWARMPQATYPSFIQSRPTTAGQYTC